MGTWHPPCIFCGRCDAVTEWIGSVVLAPSWSRRGLPRLGPIKIKLGEMLGGTGNNDNLRLGPRMRTSCERL